MDLKTDLKNIVLNEDAIKLLKNFIVGCIAYDIPQSTTKLLSQNRITLEELYKETSTAAMDLYELSKEYNTKTITINHIIEIYAGTKHIYNAALKIDDKMNKLVIAKTKQPYNKRLAQLDISLRTNFNKATFFVSDVALAGTVLSTKNKSAKVLIQTKFGKIIMLGVTIPRNLQLQINDKVLIHFGLATMVIAPIFEDIANKITSLQDNDSKFQYWLNILFANSEKKPEQITINYHKFCPYKDNFCNLKNFYEKRKI